MSWIGTAPCAGVFENSTTQRSLALPAYQPQTSQISKAGYGVFGTCGLISHQVVQQPRNFSDGTAVVSLGIFVNRFSWPNPQVPTLTSLAI